MLQEPLWHSAADQELLDARSEIEHANITGDHPSLYAPVYRNLSTFARYVRGAVPRSYICACFCLDLEEECDMVLSEEEKNST